MRAGVVVFLIAVIFIDLTATTKHVMKNAVPREESFRREEFLLKVSRPDRLIKAIKCDGQSIS